MSAKTRKSPPKKLALAAPEEFWRRSEARADEVAGGRLSAHGQGAVAYAVGLRLSTSGDLRREGWANFQEELGLPPDRDDGLFHDRSHPRPEPPDPKPVRVSTVVLGGWAAALEAMAEHLDLPRGPLLRAILERFLELPADEALRWVAKAGAEEAKRRRANGMRAG